MDLNYSKEFAISMSHTIMASEPGFSSWDAIIDCHYGKMEWLQDERNWIAAPHDECCRIFSLDELENRWDHVIGSARKKMMAFWLVEQGIAPALNPALSMVS